MIRGTRHWSPWCLGFIAFAPFFIVATAATFTHEWALQGDVALQVMRARDVGTNTPLVGAFSRYGWSHPGPILFFLLAVPAKFAENPSLWVTIAGLVLKWLPLAAAFALVKKAWGTLPAMVFLAMAHVFLVNHRDTFWTIWNPTVGLSLFVFMVILLFTFPTAKWTPMWMLLSGSILVQLHVGFVPVVGVMLAVVAFLQLRSPQREEPRRRAHHWMPTAMFPLILWIPPMWDQCFGTGNLSSLAQYFVPGPDDGTTVGIPLAIGMVGFQLEPSSAWNGRSDVASLGEAASSGPWWLTLVILLVATLVEGSRRRAPRMVRPLVSVLALNVAAILAISQATRPAYPYLFAWVTVVAWMTWMVIVVAALSLLRRPGTLGARFAMTPLAIVVAMTSWGAAHAEPVMSYEMDALRHLVPTLESLASRHDRIGVQQAEYFAGIGFGVMLELERHGTEIYVVPIADESDLQRERMWGRHRVSGSPPPLTLAVTRGPRTAEYLGSGEGWKVESTYAPDGTSITQGFNESTPENVAVLLSRVVPP